VRTAVLFPLGAVASTQSDAENGKAANHNLAEVFS